MYGAIIGDIVGSPYEFDTGEKSKDFEFWSNEVGFTDDTVLTIAIAEALLTVDKNAGIREIKAYLIPIIRTWAMRYPYKQYGISFAKWLLDKKPKPYGSYGNGSAMRVSSVGWLYDDIKRVRKVARATAEITHNHPDGIKGAEATASAIFLARKKMSKEEIKQYIEQNFKYNLSNTLEQIRSGFRHVEECQHSMPAALRAFYESDSYEDAVRNAISLGGDTDTVACITGSIAEAYWGVPQEMKRRCESYLATDMLSVLDRFILRMQQENKL